MIGQITQQASDQEEGSSVSRFRAKLIVKVGDLLSHQGHPRVRGVPLFKQPASGRPVLLGDFVKALVRPFGLHPRRRCQRRGHLFTLASQRDGIAPLLNSQPQVIGNLSAAVAPPQHGEICR
ncbi:Uncharacterised protein [Mycobacteroides abscessus subsp. abscessus]|nr:Uncharacterised protein [Mycobacteroides abscessus subsp. abscessus]